MGSQSTTNTLIFENIFYEVFLDLIGITSFGQIPVEIWLSYQDVSSARSSTL